MTREEAIHFANCLKNNYTIDLNDMQAFCDEAIKALEQEPNIRHCFGCKYSKDNHNQDIEECHLCMWENQYKPTTKNNLGVDCISRKAALDITWQDPSYTDPLNILTEVRDKIRELPSVTPQEPRKGYWLHRPHVYGVTYCSICDFELKIDNTNYCPNCGADMREVEE